MRSLGGRVYTNLTMLAPRLIEGFVFLLLVGIGLFGLYLFVDLLRLRKVGKAYKGGVGHWSWAAHRFTGVLVIGFLFGHIVDTFMVGFGPEYYDETIALYKQWWFMPFEVILVGATLFHALNGLRILLFDFWPRLAVRQKQFAYAEAVLFLLGFVPAAIFMLKKAYEHSPFA